MRGREAPSHPPSAACISPPRTTHSPTHLHRTHSCRTRTSSSSRSRATTTTARTPCWCAAAGLLAPSPLPLLPAAPVLLLRAPGPACRHARPCAHPCALLPRPARPAAQVYAPSRTVVVYAPAEYCDSQVGVPWAYGWAGLRVLPVCWFEGAMKALSCWLRHARLLAAANRVPQPAFPGPIHPRPPLPPPPASKVCTPACSAPATPVSPAGRYQGVGHPRPGRQGAGPLLLLLRPRAVPRDAR